MRTPRVSRTRTGTRSLTILCLAATAWVRCPVHGENASFASIRDISGDPQGPSLLPSDINNLGTIVGARPGLVWVVFSDPDGQLHPRATVIASGAFGGILAGRRGPQVNNSNLVCADFDGRGPVVLPVTPENAGTDPLDLPFDAATPTVIDVDDNDDVLGHVRSGAFRFQTAVLWEDVSLQPISSGREDRLALRDCKDDGGNEDDNHDNCSRWRPISLSDSGLMLGKRQRVECDTALPRNYEFFVKGGDTIVEVYIPAETRECTDSRITDCCTLPQSSNPITPPPPDCESVPCIVQITEVTDVNDSGEVVGSAEFVVDRERDRRVEWGIKWDGQGGVLPLLPLKGDAHSKALAVNNDGEAVGWSSDDSEGPEAGESRAVLWTASGDPCDLTEVARVRLGQTDWIALLLANGVNDNGDIVGLGDRGSGTPRGFLLTSRPAPFDLRVDRVEFTQAIQNAEGSLPMVIGKPVFVRAFIAAEGSPPPGAAWNGELRVFHGGVALPVRSCLSLNGPQRSPATPSREVIDSSLNFLLLVDESEAGVISGLEIEVNPPTPGQVDERDFGNNVKEIAVSSMPGPDSIAFVCRRPVSVNHVLATVSLLPGRGRGPFRADAAVLGSGPNFAERLLPVPALTNHLHAFTIDLGTYRYSDFAGDKKEIIARIDYEVRAYFSRYVRGRHHALYVWCPDALMGLLGINGRTVFGSLQDITSASYGTDRAAFFERTFAHELGHGVYRVTGELPRFTRIAPDVGIEVLGGSQTCGPTNAETRGAATFDLMTKGHRTRGTWVSASAYDFFLFQDWNCTDTALLAQEVVLTEEVPVFAVAGFTSDSGESTLLPLERFESSTIGPFDPGGSFRARLFSQEGDVVFEERFSGTPIDAETGQAQSFYVVLPVLTQTESTVQSLEVFEEGQAEPFARLERTPNPPVLRVDSPPAGSVLKDGMTVAWTSSDADGDPLVFDVEFECGASESTHPLLLDSSKTSFELDLAGIPFCEDGTLTVSASDGMNFVSTAVPARIERNAVPRIHLAFPSSPAILLEGGSMPAHVVVDDPEDGELQDRSVVWVSNLDGAVAEGTTVVLQGLTRGTHAITVTATDSGEASASTSFDLEVRDPSSPACALPPESDCQSNGIDDTCEIYRGAADDLNENGVPDECDGALVVEASLRIFPDTTVGESSMTTLSLSNDGVGSLKLVVGTEPDGVFSLNQAPEELDSMETIELTITFSPLGPGSVLGTLVLNTDDPDEPRHEVLLLGNGVAPPTAFKRGDCNGDGPINISDALCTLNWLFLGTATPGCVAATNVDGDDFVNISDPIYLLSHLFLGGPAPVAPHPDCGTSQLEFDTELGCEETSCP